MTYVLLNSVNKVNKFTKIVDNIEEDIDIKGGRYIVNAKSILGIFSLNLAEPLELIIHTEDDDRINQIKDLLVDYIV
jgi:phosphotransferase system HPr-like phosphotransfer protein